MEQIAIYGSGGFAKEVAWLVESCNSHKDHSYKVVCFVDDNVAKQGTFIHSIPVLSLEEAYQRFPESKMVGGIGSPQARALVMQKAKQIGFSFATIVHPNVEKSPWIEIGDGTVICAGSILTVDIKLGEHVQINLDCTIGHDTTLDDFATLAPGVHISGWVHIGKRVYIGTGATVINGTEIEPLVIEDDAVIGAGACVIRPVQCGTTVVGVPAKALNR